MKNKISYPYPLVFALSSTLFLFRKNVFEINIFSIFRSLIILSALTGLAYLFFKFIFRQKEIAGILTAFSMVFFTTFGSMDTFLSYKLTFMTRQDRTMCLALFCVLIMFGFLVWIIKNKKAQKILKDFLVFSSVAFLVMLLAGFATTFLRSWNNIHSAPKNTTPQVSIKNQKELPDIYFIVLDSYTSATILENDFQFDNSAFLNTLQGMGFEVIDDSYSNFDGTVYSLGTILNMEYVQSIIDPEVYDPGHRVLIDKSINSRVKDMLAGYGYHFTAFASDFPWLIWRDADYLLEPGKNNFMTSGINQFEYLVIQKSILNTILLMDKSFLDNLFFWSGKMGEDKYNEQLYLINHLSEVPQDGSPMFVYAHSTITHTPYLFHEDGSMIRPSDQGSYLSDFTAQNIRQSYLETIRFINKQLESQLSVLLQKDPNAIIILLGDHGYPGKDQNSILFAIHDPLHSIAPHECFTTINLFPSIFNQWFHMDLPLFPGYIYKTLDQSKNEFQLVKTCQTEE